MSSKGQIVLPAELRREDGLEVGEEFDIERLEDGAYRLVRSAPPPNQGVVDWLLSCPEKDWFVALESESTDHL
jgi:AbrB family looped-hinge helix DNA binding protein